MLEKLSTIDQKLHSHHLPMTKFITFGGRKQFLILRLEFSINSHTSFFTCTWTDFKKGRGVPPPAPPPLSIIFSFFLFFRGGGGIGFSPPEVYVLTTA